MRATLLSALSATLLGLLGSASSQLDAEFEFAPQATPLPGIVAGNRYTVMHIGQDGPGLGGVFPLDAPGRRVDLRLSATRDGSIDTLWLHLRRVGEPGPLSVAVLGDDGGGRPLEAPTGAVATFAVPRHPSLPGQPVWVPVGLEAPAQVSAGERVHVLLSASGAGALGPDDHVEVLSARSRFPLPWQPAPAPTPAGARLDLIGAHDPALGVMLDAGDGAGWLLQRANLKAFLPLIVLSGPDAPAQGQPFDEHVEELIGGPLQFGQELLAERDLTFDFAAFFVRGSCSELDPGCLPQLDALRVQVLERVGAGLQPVSDAAVLVDPDSEGLRAGRSHWFGAWFRGAIQLRAGHTYVLALSSPGSLGEGYVFSAERSSLPLPGAALPTWGGAVAHAVRSDDGGQSFAPLAGGEADAGFMLGWFHGLRPPLAVFDEFNALSSQQDYPVTATPGSTQTLGLLNRNIGGSLGGNLLFARLLDAATGELLDEAVHESVPPEGETHRPLSFVMPEHDLELLVEVGHLDLLGAMVVDDSVAVEVRLP